MPSAERYSNEINPHAAGSPADKSARACFRLAAPPGASFRFVIVSLLLALSSAQPIGAQEAKVVHFVTYIEAIPSKTEEALELLTAHAAGGRSAAGNLQFQALQRIGRPNHFALLETWSDAEARASHAGSAQAERFRERLAALVYSPPDERRHFDLVTAASNAGASNAIYVLTHIDVFPAGTDRTIEYLQALAAASRSEEGNLSFDALVSDRTNHMTLVEAWASTDAQARHLGTAHNKTFRSALAEVQGALYDERVYRAL